MQVNILGSPSKYIQGRDLLQKAGSYFSPYSKKILVLTDPFVYPLIKEKMEKALQKRRSYFNLNGFPERVPKRKYSVSLILPPVMNAEP